MTNVEGACYMFFEVMGWDRARWEGREIGWRRVLVRTGLTGNRPLEPLPSYLHVRVATETLHGAGGRAGGAPLGAAPFPKRWVFVKTLLSGPSSGQLHLVRGAMVDANADEPSA
jgi:hypothetical protein